VASIALSGLGMTEGADVAVRAVSAGMPGGVSGPG
jgi:hypothetical protein